MNILVDDQRNADTGIICRDFDTAKIVLQMFSESWSLEDSTLYLDHDLGCGIGKEGIDLLEWARDFDVKLPRTIVLVSANPIGVDNMGTLLVNDLHYKQDMSGRVFTHD